MLTDRVAKLTGQVEKSAGQVDKLVVRLDTLAQLGAQTEGKLNGLIAVVDGFIRKQQ